MAQTKIDSEQIVDTLSGKTLSSATLGNDLDAGGFKLTNLTTTPPSSDSDVATKGYVDYVAQGLSPKTSVRLATVVALPANSYDNGTAGVGATLTATLPGALSVDGTAVVVDDRILVKDEGDPINNGIYVVTEPGTGLLAYILTRSTDADTSTKIFGAYTFVEIGSVNSSAGFVNTNSSSPSIGTDGITFTQFSGAGEITAGDGLTKTGNTLDVGAGTGISVGADSVSIDTAVVAQKSDKLSVFAATSSAELAGVISDETGSGALVFADTPTLVTPVLGVATATTINRLTITTPATGSTLTIANGKTLTVSNSLTFTGTDTTSFAFPSTSDTVAALGTTQTFTGLNTISRNTGSTAGLLQLRNTASAIDAGLWRFNATFNDLELEGNTAVGGDFSSKVSIMSWDYTNLNIIASLRLITLSGLAIQSGAAGKYLNFVSSESLTADRNLTITVNDVARTINLAGNLTLAAAFATSGANSLTLTTTGATNVTLPTTGTLATLAGSEALTNKTYNGLTVTSSTGTLTIAAAKVLTASNTLTFAGTDGKTLTISNSLTLAGADAKTLNIGTNNLTFTTSGDTSLTLPTSGTVATLAGTETFTNKTLTSPRVGTNILDTNGNALLTVTATGSAVNAITLANGATGNNATLTASGETNTGITVTGKGTKGVLIGNAFLQTVFALTDGATPALDASLANVFTLSAAGDRTIAVPTNPVSGQKIIIAHTASGGARTLSLNTGAGGFRFGSDITTLSQTASGKTDYVGCIYNTAASFWDVIAFVKGF